MARKSNPNKTDAPKKPVVKKKRDPPVPAPEPVPEEFFEDPASVTDQDDDDQIDPEDDDEGIGQHGGMADSITAPSQSIFKHGKGFDTKYDGTFNEFTDGVMFNPSEPPMGFDSEWVRFLNQLSADETTKSMADYIRIAPLTRRAKYKLMIYIKTLLDREFTMSNITDQNDMVSVNLDKLLIDADLTLGLTRFDLSPEFQHIINLVRIKFGIKSRRSLYGFERINVNTQRSVQDSNDNSGGGGGMEVRKSIQSRIKDLFQSD
jgi:hypothetical protein